MAYGASRLLRLVDMQAAPRVWLSVIVLWSLVLTLEGVWQLVGAWRSATNRIRARRLIDRRAIWAHLARCMVALGALLLAVQTVRNVVPASFASLQIVFGADPTPPHTVRLVADGTAILLSGGIGTGTADEFRTLLAASPGVQRIDLVSKGGRVAEADDMAALIRARGLSTHTDGFCASACTIVYMAGRTRSIGPGGRLGFHRYSFPGLTEAQEIALNIKGERTLTEAGVRPGFVAKAFATPSSDVWVPDQPALLDARVVTLMIEGGR